MVDLPTATIHEGDALSVLRTLPDASVHCCVTSPPYWGLRDYGHEGQMGLERTPEEYVAGMVAVFREVRRVLTDDGTLWLNLGDSYNAYNGGAGPGSKLSRTQTDQRPQLSTGYGLQCKTLKPKDLVGIPWRVAFALQADGWYLRQDIVWHKPSPMPESVQDRCTKAHEYVFLLSKSARYYYDIEAVKEQATYAGTEQNFSTPYKHAGRGSGKRTSGNERIGAPPVVMADTRNRRSVWTIATQPFPGAHFAVMPPDLVEPCILAGTSEEGCCPNCLKPFGRLTARRQLKRERPNALTKRHGDDGTGNACANDVAGVAVETMGWRPSCECQQVATPCTVLDPFTGSGTVGMVANRLGRHFVGVELNPVYAAMARERIAGEMRGRMFA